MSKMDEYMRGRNEGIDYSLRIVRKREDINMSEMLI